MKKRNIATETFEKNFKYNPYVRANRVSQGFLIILNKRLI